VDTQDICLAIRPYFEQLAELETADAIRDFLEARRVRGNAYQPESCPIARYLHKSSTYMVTVGYGKILSLVEGRLGGEVGTPTPAMVDFILRFDLGDYPTLMEKELVAV
jgi:hypothetical protein